MSHLTDMLSFVQCDGAALWVGGQWTLHGAHPPPEAMTGLLDLARQRAGTQIWHTACLSALIPDAANYATQAAGVMIVPISSQPGDYLLVFRREVARTLKWSADPASRPARRPRTDISAPHQLRHLDPAGHARMPALVGR